MAGRELIAGYLVEHTLQCTGVFGAVKRLKLEGPTPMAAVVAIAAVAFVGLMLIASSHAPTLWEYLRSSKVRPDAERTAVAVLIILLPGVRLERAYFRRGQSKR